jgi:hypothetical protein
MNYYKYDELVQIDYEFKKIKIQTKRERESHIQPINKFMYK